MTYLDWQMIAATPWWIYPFAGYLLWASLMAVRPRLVSVKALSIMPLFFMALSVMSMTAMQHSFQYAHLFIWGGTFFLGTGLGYIHLALLKRKVNHSTHSLCLPGNWFWLGCFFALLFSKFFFGFEWTVDSSILIDPHYAMLLVFLYGLVTGLCTGRLGYTLRCLQSGPPTPAP